MTVKEGEGELKDHEDRSQKGKPGLSRETEIIGDRQIDR